MRISQQFTARRIAINAASLVLIVFLYNEYLIYWHQMSSNCSWPRVNESQSLLNMMILADTHLLGSRNGHWFDKLRREWQQHRSFQTARQLFQPDLFVILGDLTDEGKWCSDAEWKYYQQRAQELFYVNQEQELLVLVGNHDVGFHYDLSAHKLARFNKSFQTQQSMIQLFHPRNKKQPHVHFVLVNSMALENDGCSFCRQAQKDLVRINKTLECLLNNGDHSCSNYIDSLANKIYSKPIIFSHFPLQRTTDNVCTNLDEPDSELSITGKLSSMKPKYDCLSQQSTFQLIKNIRPRLVFDGHTHYSCYNEQFHVPEFTLSSFSWRNLNAPSFLLVQIDSSKHYVSKCYLPTENSVINIYAIAIVALGFYILASICFTCSKRRSVSKNDKIY